MGITSWKNIKLNCFSPSMQHTSLSYQRGRHNLSVGNVTLKSNSALKKQKNIKFLCTYLLMCLWAWSHSYTVFWFSFHCNFHQFGPLISSGFLKKRENVHFYLQGKQSNWSKLDCLPPLILEHYAMAEAAAPYFGNCSGISGFDLAAGWWLAHVSTLL